MGERTDFFSFLVPNYKGLKLWKNKEKTKTQLKRPIKANEIIVLSVLVRESNRKSTSGKHPCSREDLSLCLTLSQWDIFKDGTFLNLRIVSTSFPEAV